MARIPDGNYPAIPCKIGESPVAQLGVSKAKKSPQVLIWFQVTDGPYKGSRVPWFGYFSKDSAERTIGALRLCGFSGQDIYDIENQKLDGSVLVTVENASYQGKSNCRVAWVNDPSYTGEIEIEGLDAKATKTLDSVLKGLLG